MVGEDKKLKACAEDIRQAWKVFRQSVEHGMKQGLRVEHIHVEQAIIDSKRLNRGLDITITHPVKY